MYEQFKTRAVAVSAEVYRHPTKAAALEFICGFMQREGLADAPGSHAVWAACPCLTAEERQHLQQQSGIKLQVSQELAATARFGISQMDWALADTGSVVQDSTGTDQRLVSSLTDIHIALLPTGAILPDMPTLLTKLRPESSAYIAMITGPSRTADIERVLTIGVHGPERLVIVFCDELN